MIYLQRSSIDPTWIEIRDETGVHQEVEVRFPLRRFPKRFDSVELAVKWLHEMERKLAKNRAYRLLSARSYPSALLYSKLIEKGYSSAICQSIVDELKQLGYLQDDEWIRQAIEREFRRGYGPRYIELKLRAKGLQVAARDHITDSMQKEKIRELLKKTKAANRQKAIQSIARKGFDLHLILQFLD